MIKILPPAGLVEIYYRRLIGEIGNGKSILKRIQNWAEEISDLNTLEAEFAKIISNENFFKKIITGNPEELEDIKNGELSKFSVIFSEDIIFSAKVLKIFGYENFRKNYTSRWLARSLNIKSCPYCNSQYTLLANKDLLFEFDHFFPKKKYPYLSVSFYNLIPVCSSCNRKKGDDEFDINRSYHPYVNSLYDTFKFSIDNKSCIKYLLNQKENLNDIRIEMKRCIEKDKGDIFENHLSKFPIESIYENHKDLVAELLLKSQIYNKSRKTELLNYEFQDENGNSEQLFTESELNQLIIGNYIEEKDCLQRPLSKLTKDIAEELDLL